MIVALQHEFLVLYHENTSTSIYIMKNNRKIRKYLRKPMRIFVTKLCKTMKIEKKKSN